MQWPGEKCGLNLYKAHNKFEKHGIMRRFMTRTIDRATRTEHIG
jgi:hypothetical protein